MYYNKLKHRGLLEKFIECYWILKEDNCQIIREINPTTNISVCFHLSGKASYKILTSDLFLENSQSLKSICEKFDNSEVTAQDVIIGQHRTMIVEKLQKGIDCFGIEFKTGMRKTFFGNEMSSLTENIVPIEKSDNLLSKLPTIISKSNIYDVFENVNNFLTDYFLTSIHAQIINPNLFEIINKIYHKPNEVDINHISEELNMSVRNLERIFKTFTGSNPKQFICLRKIHEVAVDMIKTFEDNHPEINVLGYYDRSHVSSRFKQISGLSVIQIFQKFSNYLSFSPDAICINRDETGICGIIPII
ncbi:MAG: helix-turn-helix domain-containing protein [Bacteroidales bacterium]|nr:helix-turn-helix domain-containing protein [Bacteroidales bacterium]